MSRLVPAVVKPTRQMMEAAMDVFPERIGRWAHGDIAEDRRSGKLYRVVGFILNPAVCFHEIVPDGEPVHEMVQVAGCPNELMDLRRYRRDVAADERPYIQRAGEEPI